MVKNPKFTNIFVVSLTEFLMLFLSLKLIGKLCKILALNCTPDVLELINLALFIIPIIVCLVYMWLTYPDKLKVFITGGAGMSIKALGIGLAIGLVMNLALCLLSLVNGSVKYSFVGFNPLLLVALPVCFIQCASEEILIRGYASSYMEDRYSEDVVAFTGGVLFVLHHIGNLRICGFSAVFCLNIFLMGILLYLSVKLTHSIWAAFGIHTAWNYTQSFIFGGENSGMDAVLAFFSSSDGKKTFFYDTVYGNEGTWICTIFLLIAVIIMYLMYKKRNNKDLKGSNV